MATFSQLQDVKNRIVRELSAEKQKIDTSRASFQASETALTNMQTTYAGWATEIDALAAQFPNNQAVQLLKAEKDLLVSEFMTTKTLATNLKGAVSGV